MTNPDATQITLLLQRWREGDLAAERQLFDVLHAELRRIASRLLRPERLDHTLQPTELVHEAYVRLAPPAGDWRDRTHFLAVAARVMRHVLIDHARAHRRQKRSGAIQRITLSDDVVKGAPPDVDLQVFDQALGKLETLDARKARFIEMRYFAGLSNIEIAEATGVSERTVKRELQFSRAWLRREIEEHAV
ncbi:MAG: ECF-type sigma factor [Longimicrobiales bacterium]